MKLSVYAPTEVLLENKENAKPFIENSANCANLNDEIKFNEVLENIYNLDQKIKEIREIIFSMDSPLIVFHHDADGISSAAIAYKALKKCGKKPRLFMAESFNKNTIDFIINEKELIILDLGSSELVNSLNNAVIIDHHQIFDKIKKPMLNPNNGNINTSLECSSSTLSFLVFKELPEISLVGSAGDMQIPFSGINGLIANKLVSLNYYIKERNSFKFKHIPLKLALKMSKIKVFQNDQSVQYFLNELKINPWKKFIDLNKQERTNFINALTDICYYTEDQGLNKLIFDEYIIANNNYSLTSFATLLNAAGRWKHWWVGIKACLNDQEALKESEKLLYTHRKKLKEGYEIAKRCLTYKDNVIIFKSSKINPSIIGIVCNKIKEEYKKPVIGICEKGETCKISIRADNINVAELIKRSCNEIEAISAGGHLNAGGAEINNDYVDLFIDNFIYNMKECIRFKNI
jgi:RecJ-like exonuclease